MSATDSLELERTRLAEAERRQRILSEVSQVLLDYVGPDEVEPLRRIVERVSAALGDWCAFSLVQPDGTILNVASHHPDERQRELAQKINALLVPQQWDGGNLQYNALVQKKPLVIEEISDELLKQSVPSEELYRLYQQIGMTSVVIAPMFDGGQPLGTLALITTGRNTYRYTNDDVDFVFALAGRAALGVRNARLVRELGEQRDAADRRAAQLQSVFQNDPNGIALFGSDGRLQLASPRLEEIFGIKLSAMLGSQWQQIYQQKLAQAVSVGREQHLARVREIFEDQGLRSIDEIELERPRHRWLERQSVPVRRNDGAYLGRLMVYTDITERRELDRQRSDFLTVAAHELRTPLTPLSMYLQNIERRIQRGEPVDAQLLRKADRQVGRLGKLVEDLLDLSRLESKRMQFAPEPVDLNELVDQVVADFRADVRNHEVVFQRLPEPLSVVGDAQRLEQVLVNLLGNAIKYSPEGGRILVRVQRTADEARVSVTDPGIGIPKEEQDSLFQRFFRAGNATTRNYSGLGIGLYVSNEIVQRHGGRFLVESDVGRGATFTFCLPFARSEVRAPQRQRILVVDDDPEILEATSQLLREWGYAVDEARDGATALSLARGAKPDLMLVDLMMPVMDGWTLIGKVRNERLAEGVPVVVFSADRDTRNKAKTLQADAALRKPFALQELQDVIERFLGQRRPS